MRAKICIKCKLFKPLSEFHKNKNKKDGLNKYCKLCRHKFYKKYRKTFLKKAKTYRKTHRNQCLEYTRTHKKEAKNNRLKKRYDITLKEYIKMNKRQNGVCAICGKKEIQKNNNGEITALSVDHNHKTRKVRKLLCYKCNHVLGLVNDNILLLKKTIKYLEKFL